MILPLAALKLVTAPDGTPVVEVELVLDVEGCTATVTAVVDATLFGAAWWAADEPHAARSATRPTASAVAMEGMPVG
jgi:hypothetical protein